MEEVGVALSPRPHVSVVSDNPPGLTQPERSDHGIRQLVVLSGVVILSGVAISGTEEAGDAEGDPGDVHALEAFDAVEEAGDSNTLSGVTSSAAACGAAGLWGSTPTKQAGQMAQRVPSRMPVSAISDMGMARPHPCS